jgi:hypothetical protein
MYVSLSFVLWSMVSSLSCHIHVSFNPFMMFFCNNIWCRALSTHPTSVHLFGSQSLLLTVALSLPLLKVVWKSLKQLTSRGCRAWEVWKGKVTISNPNSCAYFMDSNLTCEPHLSKLGRCPFDWKMHFEIDLLKNERNSFNRNDILHDFFYIVMHVPNFQCLM